MNCWPLAAVSGTKHHDDRVFGGDPSLLAEAIVVSPDGHVLYNGSNSGSGSSVPGNLLHWPNPLEVSSYAFTDFPRFTVPPWGPTPLPSGSTYPPGTEQTNGYDFNNDVAGDTYVFLLGNKEMNGWWEGREAFLKLTGPTPLLPDFAFGVWYTWYNSYTERRAKDEIGNWTMAKFPLDVWGLDMYLSTSRSLAKSRSCARA